MTIERHAAVGDVAANVPGALQALQELKIDFCCGGKRPLEDALAERGLNVEEFLERAKAHASKRRGDGERDFARMRPAALSGYIEEVHHAYLWRALPEIGELLLSVIKAHGRNHPELFEVYKLYGRLRSELEQHLVKEELSLFPALEKGPDASRAQALEIIGEHQCAGELLEALRRITSDYRVPEDACLTWRRAYAMLEELEGDLHQHIHLENNILLKGFA